jgi:hypothetical protein
MTQYVPLAEDLAAKAARAVLLLGCFLVLLALRRRALIGPSILATAVAALVAADLASIAHGIHHSVSWQSLETGSSMSVDALRSARQRMYLYQTMSTPFPGQIPRPITGLEHLSQLPRKGESFEQTAAELWRGMFSDIPMVPEVGTMSGDDDGITRISDITLRETVSSIPREAAVKLLRTFGVAELAGWTPLDTAAVTLERSEGDPPLFVYRVRDALPPVYFASRLVLATAPDEVFRSITRADFSPGADVVVEAMPSEWQPTNATPSGDVHVVSWTDRTIELLVGATGPEFLVVNDSYFPGWVATIDGRFAPIVRANYLARGVVIGAGNHRVEMVYRPRSLLVGVAISIATAVLLTASLGVSSRRSAAHARS